MRRSSRAACLAAVAGVLVCLGGLADPVGATTAKPAPCGGETPTKSNGTKWVCTLDDEFNGSSVSSADWTVVNTATVGFRGGQECDTAGNVRETGGLLVITATRVTSKCGRYSTKFDSGMIMSKGKFSQAYGRFEIRAKFPAGRGLQPAFWLVPEDPNSTGHYQYGEIDVAEAYGHLPTVVEAHLHYVKTPGTPGNGRLCSVPTNESAFHTYALVWTSTQMTFLYDGATCWSTSWEPKAGYAPASARAPVPFDQPFYIILQLAVGGGKTPANMPGRTTAFPVSMDVDYIRVWR